MHMEYLAIGDAVNLAALRAVPLIVLAIPALVAAGLIESFMSPTDDPFFVKALVGLGAAALLYGYLLHAGEKAEQRVGP